MLLLLCLRRYLKQAFKLASSSNYELMGRRTLASSTDQLYDECDRKLKKVLQGQESLSITSDAATLNNGHPFLSVTGHFIDRNWRMVDCVLRVVYAPTSHSGDYIEAEVATVIRDLGVNGKVYAITTDNGANFVKGAGQLVKHDIVEEKLRCICHDLHLSVTKALSVTEIQPCLAAVKAVVNYFRRSPVSAHALKNNQEARVAKGIPKGPSEAEMELVLAEEESAAIIQRDHVRSRSFSPARLVAMRKASNSRDMA
jgi:hypothetical protein